MISTPRRVSAGRRPVGPLLVPLVLSCATAWGCSAAEDSAASRETSAAFGEPLPGLSDAELARFEAGKALFRRRFTASEGLGPRFNEDACNACHTDPADGGTGETSVTRATRLDPSGVCDPLVAAGGENLRIRTTGAAPSESVRLRPPPEATHVSGFSVPFVFGLGLVEAIPEATLAALADPDDHDGNGISGRLGRDASGRTARFGRKSDVATLADFVESAFRLEMGLTTPSAADESRAGALPPVPDGADPAPEPEIERATLDAVTDFVRFLAPPRRALVEDTTRARLARRGEALFEELGCVRCHVPALEAGPDPVPAIAGATIRLYSDLLLHDMGPGLEGTCTAHAGTREYRTEPLMGLRMRRTFLHDGRAGRVSEAILSHGGEARAARDGFARLDRLTQEALLRFLDTL